MLRGIDIAYPQAGLDLATVASKVDFVFVKATDGVSIVDPNCDGWVEQASALGLRWGFYHEMTAATGIAQADWFYENCKNYFGHGIPVLVIEGMTGYPNDPGRAEDFVRRLQKLSGITPMLYIGGAPLSEKRDEWQRLLDLGCALWIANYYYGYEAVGYEIDQNCMSDPSPWPFASAWQFTSCGDLGAGYRFDLDLFFGDAAAWDAIAGSSDTTGDTTATPDGSILELAASVMRGEFGDGDERRGRLGSRYGEVQDFVNGIFSQSAQALAARVWAGDFGNGDVRRAVLGPRYDEVMSVVNRSDSAALESVARDVIRGAYGNGRERRERLAAAGYDPDEVQRKVNDML